ncbi:kell blood group glycoprotein-like isoform X1 [Myxocyprinus asiaticus]|uniref:kell blood group glycoprotein-like isoform X1 n=1 Tax=Myxocyprinus asiaticus TaxID=70543 RepID=UPI002221F70E|nr:kell blood group glycoprotein-like isoform X1 [Myxocyprinus asiaticus]
MTKDRSVTGILTKTVTKEKKKKMDENPTVFQEMVTMPEEQPQFDELNPVACNKCRKLLLVVFAFSLFATALGLGIYSHHQKTKDPWTSQWKSAPPCLSPACLRASESFSVALDPFSHPCDYYLLACGAGGSSPNRGRKREKGVSSEDSGGQDKKRAVRRERLVEIRRETDVQGKNYGQQDKFPDRQTALLKAIKEVLEAPDEGVSMNTAEQKAKKFFKSCMDSESPEKVGSEPFFTLLHQLGGWPVSGGWNLTDFNTTLALLMGQYSTFPFFNVYVGPDSSDSNQYYIQIDEPHFQLPIDWNSTTHKSKASSQYLRPFLSSCGQYLTLLGVPSSSFGTHCGLYISLFTNLALATSPRSYRLSQQLLYNRITIQELQTLAPAIDWIACLQATFQPLPINQSDLVLVHNLPYIIHMSKTISQWQVQHEIMGTSPLHTYMIFNLLQTLIPALDSRFNQIRRNFSITTGDTQEDIPRWLKCVQQTKRGFDTLLGHVIKERHTQKEISSSPYQAEELIHDIYSSLKIKLADMSWRDMNSSGVILNKITSVTPSLSTKTDALSHTELNQIYAEVFMREEDYFSNYLEVLGLEQKSRSRLLSHGRQTEGLSITPFLSGNDIIIPAGMFVSPFFHPSYPRAVNYGTLGSLMAKDLLHLLLPDIHTQAKNPELESECVWFHYLSVTEGPGRVGAFSLSPSKQQEVWVQYTALQVALHAYKTSFTRHPADSSLSGLSYAHLFLSSFIKVSCDADSYREFMPFEPSFLVTVLCSNTSICPKPLTCLNKYQNSPPEMCQSRTLP